MDGGDVRVTQPGGQPRLAHRAPEQVLALRTQPRGQGDLLDRPGSGEFIVTTIETVAVDTKPSEIRPVRWL
ncbi:hypothetical protein [Nonomuraea sp. KM90]|uniref:hypothetical protein n=1 Tax=Nonomuraea sp. KM90 TaxID=3457428 RepID=UPI003FCDE371